MISGSGIAIGPTREASIADRFLSHGRIVAALAKRDVQSRFGESWMSYAWSFLAPFAWIGATWLAFYLLGRSSPVYADLVTFIISGLIPYALFRYVVTAVGRTQTTIRGLRLYPPIVDEHAVAASAMVELVNGLILLASAMAVNWLAFGNGEMTDPLAFFWGLSLAWALGLSYGYLFSSLARFNPRFNQLGQAILRPTFFLSAVFFTANELPEHVLDWLGWNPLLHAIEIARDGMLFSYQSRVASVAYVLIWVAALGIGGVMISVARRG